MALDRFPEEEGAPLLVERNEDHPPRAKYWYQVERPRTIVILISVLIFILATSGQVMTVPQTRLLESALCSQYYDVQGQKEIDEKLCKIDEIQSQLAYLNGLISMLEAIFGW